MGLPNSYYISILRIKIYKVCFSMYVTLMHSHLGLFLLQYDTRGQNMVICTYTALSHLICFLLLFHSFPQFFLLHSKAIVTHTMMILW